ncbi:MAG: universal stress protein [Pseudomonadota bacterium]
MKSIILATDFSDRAERAAARAIALAKAQGAALNLVHIVDAGLPSRISQSQQKAAEAQLEETAEAATAEGVGFAISVKSGEAHEAISEAAAETAAELIVIGAHRRDPKRNAFVGTTAERMIRVGSTPVLIVRSETPTAYGRIVVAVNLTDEGVGHLERVQKLGLSGADGLAPVFGYDAGEFHLMRDAGASQAQLQTVFEAEKTSIMPTVSKLMGEAGLGADQAIVKPILLNTPDTILSAAKEANADLLVVGARRRTTFKRYTLGSVSEACLLRAETDLLVLPPEV